MVHRLAIEPMAADAFAPYGVVLSGDSNRAPDYADADSVGWRHRVDLIGTPELVVVRTSFVGRRFSRLERHLTVTQAFFPFRGVPAALAVARPQQDPDEPPLAHQVRAFAVVPGVGYLLHPNTWHSLDRYPLWPGSIEVVMLTAMETTREAETAAKADWRLTQEVDYRERDGLEFELVLGAT